MTYQFHTGKSWFFHTEKLFLSYLPEMGSNWSNQVRLTFLIESSGKPEPIPGCAPNIQARANRLILYQANNKSDCLLSVVVSHFSGEWVLIISSAVLYSCFMDSQMGLLRLGAVKPPYKTLEVRPYWDRKTHRQKQATMSAGGPTRAVTKQFTLLVHSCRVCGPNVSLCRFSCE